MSRRPCHALGPRLAGRAAAVRAAAGGDRRARARPAQHARRSSARSRSPAPTSCWSRRSSRGPGTRPTTSRALGGSGSRPGVLVASWDNLSSKGRVRTLPDAVLVWNEAQRDEAVALHGVPPSRVVADRRPAVRSLVRPLADVDSQRQFRRAGRPSRRPRVRAVRRLHSAGRSTRRRSGATSSRGPRRSARSDDPLGARPRRARAPASDDGDAGRRRPRRSAIARTWSCGAASPVRRSCDDDRDAYFDSIQHATAVLGINSSAMIEAAIVGRPVYTVRLPELYEMQRGLLHYHHLLPENGGFLREATSWDEHVAMLTADLRDPAPNRERQLRFLTSFVRPLGLEQPATPLVADAIERLGRSSPSAPSRSPLRVPGPRRTRRRGDAATRGGRLASGDPAAGRADRRPRCDSTSAASRPRRTARPDHCDRAAGSDGDRRSAAAGGRRRGPRRARCAPRAEGPGRPEGKGAEGRRRNHQAGRRSSRPNRAKRPSRGKGGQGGKAGQGGAEAVRQEARQEPAKPAKSCPLTRMKWQRELRRLARRHRGALATSMS